MAIKLHPLASSNIDSAGYDPESKTMEIHFKNGSAYQYEGVPKSVYEGLFKADSPGGYFHRWISKASYKSTKKK